MPKFPMFNSHQKSEIQYMRKILIDRGVHVNKVDLLSVPSLIIKHFAVKLLS